MHMDFIGVAMDEILNQASKMRYMFGGKTAVPHGHQNHRRRRCQRGGTALADARSTRGAHPRSKVVVPSDAEDAKGLLIAAIRDDNPVVFIAHKLLMAKKGEVPDEEYVVPIGKAKIRREGKDVTLVSWSKMVLDTKAAAEELAEQGIDAEVIDLRTIKPMDEETLINSVKKTGRLVIVHEATRVNGFGAEIAATVSEKAFEYLKAPILRVTAPDCPSPFSPVLEAAYLPNAEKIVEAVKSIVK